VDTILPRSADKKLLTHLKIACSFVCFVILASQVWSMSHWSERRGVYDDIGYLRQAHLFQRFGLAGLDTDIARDDDSFTKNAAKDIQHIAPSDPNAVAPLVHTFMPKSGKWVIQYPPGTGFALSLFPTGYQAIGLYIFATTIIFLMSITAIFQSLTTRTILTSAALGCAAIYFMINPVKASYSVAPTMIVCALAGYLTSLLYDETRAIKERWIASLAIGFLLGLAVNFRIPNALLAAGYCTFFLLQFIKARTVSTFITGLVFGCGFVAGTIPTLAANAINAGSPLSTTYSAQDTLPPDWSFSIAREYMADLQGLLIAIAFAWTAWMLLSSSSKMAKRVAVLTLFNLVANVIFFFSHQIFTQYYLMPAAMLALWSLLFASLGSERTSLASAWIAR
jgi:hypothetical protein